MRRLRPTLTYSNVTASLALFIALGGTSYAVTKLPKNSVGSEQVRDGTIKRVDLDGGAVASGSRGPRGAIGPAGVAGPQGPQGSSNLRMGSVGSAALSQEANVPTTVVRLADVPAGSYFASFSGEADYRVETAGLYIVCQIQVNGVTASVTRGIVGDKYGGTEVLADMTTITRTAPFDLTVVCRSDQPTAAPSHINFAKLALMKMESVTNN